MEAKTSRPQLSADRKAAAVVEIESLVKGGSKVRAAVEEVAYRTGLSESSLFKYLEKTRGVPEGKWSEELSRKPAPPRPRAVCHPDALSRFIDLARDGRRVTECYRQVVEEAQANGWGSLPSERTLRRALDRQITSTERFFARRRSRLQ